MSDGGAPGQRDGDMVRSDVSETELIVDGPHALDEKTDDQGMRDVFRHALIAEIVKMEIIACHQLQIGPGLGDEPHRIARITRLIFNYRRRTWTRLTLF